MAHFTAQGRVKLLFSGEPKDPFQYKLRSSQPDNRTRLRFSGSTRIHSFSSSLNKPNSLGADAPWSLSDESVYRHNQAHDHEALDDDDDDYDDDEDEDEDTEFERDELACFRGLVLDISYRPINVVCWKRAICLEFMEKADVLEYYDQTVNSPTGSFYIPAVLRVPHLLQVVKRRRIKSNLSRKNLLHRDGYICQYCSSSENLTIDHVLPVARGGEWTWENLVTACAKCNSKKGHKTLEEAKMKLIMVPKAPKDYDILAIPLTNAAIRMLKMRNGTPEEWLQYLP